MAKTIKHAYVAHDCVDTEHELIKDTVLIRMMTVSNSHTMVVTYLIHQPGCREVSWVK